jgi:hypothetical protein
MCKTQWEMGKVEIILSIADGRFFLNFCFEFLFFGFWICLEFGAWDLEF